MARQVESLASGWARFESSVMPDGAPPDQVREMRRSFYAGVHWMLSGPLAEVGEPDFDEAEALEALEGLQAEIAAFDRLVQQGKA